VICGENPSSETCCLWTHVDPNPLDMHYFVHMKTWIWKMVVYICICGVPEIGVSPNHPFSIRIFHCKPSIWGYHHFWKALLYMFGLGYTILYSGNILYEPICAILMENPTWFWLYTVATHVHIQILTGQSNAERRSSQRVPAAKAPI
jgi:hypothetical protein